MLWTHGITDGAGAACTITNVSSLDIDASIELINDSGDVVDSSDVTVPPGTSNDTVGSSAQGNYHCKFVVQKANKVRANLIVLAQANGVVFTRAAAEAR